MSRHERTECRQRPREPAHARRARRRRVRRQRSEGVDLRRAPRRLVPLLRPHRPRRTEAQGHLGADRRHDVARRRAATVPGADRPATSATSTRCSSTTCAYRRTHLSGRCTAAGRSPRDRSRTSGRCCGSPTPTTCSGRRTRSSRSATVTTPSGGRLGDDARFRDAVAGFYVDAQALLTMGYRGLLEVPARQVVARALAAEALRQRVAAEGVAVRCARRSVRTRSTPTSSVRRCGARGAGQIQYLRSFGATIPGGTSEVQRNIIAERVLGLPRAEVRRGAQKPPSRVDSTQNSLPSGIGEHDPGRLRPTGRRRRAVAPSARMRSTSASRSSGARSMCSRFFVDFVSGTGTNTMPGIACPRPWRSRPRPAARTRSSTRAPRPRTGRASAGRRRR